MSATTNPPGPIGMVRVGTDLRDLGREINRVIAALNATLPIVRNLCAPSRKPGIPPPSLGVRLFPFRVYLDGGFVCVQQAHHLWWNSNTNAITTTTLEKLVADAWVASGSATVIYLKRVYNSDGTATVTLENANTDFATVSGLVTYTEARWILATISAGVVTQWWTGGDIYELRVA